MLQSRRAVVAPYQWLRIGVLGTFAIVACGDGEATGPDLTVAEVEVTAPATTIEVGATVQLSAAGFNASGEELEAAEFVWSSGSQTIATVNASTGLVTGVAPGSVEISAAEIESGEAGSITIVVIPAAVASVAVEPASIEIERGDTAHLEVVLRDARNVILTGREIQWTSSNEAVATVDEQGVVHAVSAGGPVTITATSEGVSDQAAITVTLPPVATVMVDPSSVSMHLGDSLQFTAYAISADGDTLTGHAVTWISGSTGVAQVSTSGMVRAVGVGGPITIIAMIEGRSGTSELTVTPVPVASVVVDPPTATIEQGQTLALTAHALSADGDTLSGRIVTWTTSDSAIATVNAAGVVTATGVGGPITITAAAEGASGTAAITVTPIPVASVVVDPATATIEEGDTIVLVARTVAASGDTLTGRPVSWTSSDTAIATVDGAGIVTGVNAGGPVTITATAEGVSGTASVTVTAPAIAAIDISPDSTSVDVGATTQLSVAVIDTRGDTVSGAVTWTSLDAAIASVDGSGLVAGLDAGLARIVASVSGRADTALVLVVDTVGQFPSCTTADPSVGNLVFPDTVEATLGTGGCVTEDGFYVHAWTFQPGADVTAVFDLGSTAFDTYLSVQDSSGMVLGESDDEGTGTDSRLILGLTGGTYRVVVRSYNPAEVGAYTLSVIDLASSNECMAIEDYVAGSISIGSSAQAELGTGGCYSSGDGHYYHGWSLSIPADTVIQVDVGSTAFDAQLYAYSADAMTFYGGDDDAGDAQLTLPLRAGEYLLLVTSAAEDGTGLYSIGVQGVGTYIACTWPGDYVEGAIGVEDTVAGALEASDCVNGTAYSDVWTLDIASDTSMRIDLASGEFDTFLVLYDSASGQLVQSDDAGGGTNSSITYAFTPGRYYIEVTSYNGFTTGAYTLTTTTANVCATADDFVVGTVAAGDVISGALETTDCLDGNWYTDGYVLDLASDTTLQFDLASTEFNAYLALMDSTFALVAWNDDAAGTSDSRITVNLTAGRYYVIASSMEEFATGAYTLSVTEVEPLNICETITVVGLAEIDSTQSGVLAAGDCQLPDGSYAESWQLNLATTTTVSISMESVEFNTYLTLMNEFGETYAQNDDDPAGGTTNSAISIELSAGTYYIIANTLAPGETGAYTLTVTD